MPQLDIMSYFSQFQWLILVVIASYIIVVACILPAIKKNLISRNFYVKQVLENNKRINKSINILLLYRKNQII